MLHRAVLLAVTVWGLAHSSLAHGDDRPVAVGVYAGADLGARGLVGKHRRYANVGPSFGIHLGTDLFSWLSVGGRADMSSHKAKVPPPPEGEYFQLYSAAGEARLSLRILRVSVFAEGALGMTAISTNLLEKVDLLEPGERFSPMFAGGGGLEYQLQNRHYALGISGQWAMFPAFDRVQVWDGKLYLRYTY